MLGYVPEIAALDGRKVEAQKRDDRRYELAKAIAVELCNRSTITVSQIHSLAVAVADGVLHYLEREAASDDDHKA